VDGPIFSSLLVGPCALEFTKLKTIDHLWSDPNADELLQRHRMHNICHQNSIGSSSFNSNNTSLSTHNSSLSITNNSSISNSSSIFYFQTPKTKLGLNASAILKRNAVKNLNNLSIEEPSTSNNNSINSPFTFNSSKNNCSKSPMTPLSNNISNSSPPGSVNNINANAKEYVESLHQNSKSQLIYGKNYVIVYPVINFFCFANILKNTCMIIKKKEEMDGLPGYLSLHLNYNSNLTLKWTPNQLMNASPDDSIPIRSKK
jgi:hypothetical protein